MPSNINWVSLYCDGTGSSVSGVLSWVEVEVSSLSGTVSVELLLLTSER